jgi:hypothetical protein
MGKGEINTFKTYLLITNDHIRMTLKEREALIKLIKRQKEE